MKRLRESATAAVVSEEKPIALFKREGIIR
jgi:hypothetical protein